MEPAQTGGKFTINSTGETTDATLPGSRRYSLTDNCRCPTADDRTINGTTCKSAYSIALANVSGSMAVESCPIFVAAHDTAIFDVIGIAVISGVDSAMVGMRRTNVYFSPTESDHGYLFFAYAVVCAHQSTRGSQSTNCGTAAIGMGITTRYQDPVVATEDTNTLPTRLPVARLPLTTGLMMPRL